MAAVADEGGGVALGEDEAEADFGGGGGAHLDGHLVRVLDEVVSHEREESGESAGAGQGFIRRRYPGIL